MSLCAARSPIFIAPRLARSYAAKSGPPAGLKGSNEFVGDSKSDVLKGILYPPNLHPPPTNRTSPPIAHRPDVESAVAAAFPSKEAHDTIRRAYLLLRRKEAEARRADLELRERRLRAALDDLEKSHPARFALATEGRERVSTSSLGGRKQALLARIPGLFPREMRAPTDTPRTKVWDHDWKAVVLDA